MIYYGEIRKKFYVVDLTHWTIIESKEGKIGPRCTCLMPQKNLKGYIQNLSHYRRQM